MAAALALSLLGHASVLMAPLGYRHASLAGDKPAVTIAARLVAPTAPEPAPRPPDSPPPGHQARPATMAAPPMAGAASRNPLPGSSPLDLTVKYFRNAEVDIRAAPIDPPPLIYPERAYRDRIGGQVRMLVYINERGAIDAIHVTAAEPPGIFEEAAITAVASTRFTPAKLLGRAVKTVKEIEVDFDPYEKISLP